MHKILIVDDEVDVLDTVVALVDGKLMGCDIDKATNGLDAFIACQNNVYDLIITDHKMPFMTGAAFVIALRTKETESKNAPVIMLSGHIDQELKKNLSIQNVKFITKPFTPDDLIDIIRTYLV